MSPDGGFVTLSSEEPPTRIKILGFRVSSRMFGLYAGGANGAHPSGISETTRFPSTNIIPFSCSWGYRGGGEEGTTTPCSQTDIKLTLTLEVRNGSGEGVLKTSRDKTICKKSGDKCIILIASLSSGMLRTLFQLRLCDAIRLRVVFKSRTLLASGFCFKNG